MTGPPNERDHPATVRHTMAAGRGARCLRNTVQGAPVCFRRFDLQARLHDGKRCPLRTGGIEPPKTQETLSEQVIIPEPALGGGVDADL
jgi:hypothetical protein